MPRPHWASSPSAPAPLRTHLPVRSARRAPWRLPTPRCTRRKEAAAIGCARRRWFRKARSHWCRHRPNSWRARHGCARCKWNSALAEALSRDGRRLAKTGCHRGDCRSHFNCDNARRQSYLPDRGQATAADPAGNNFQYGKGRRCRDRSQPTRIADQASLNGSGAGRASVRSEKLEQVGRGTINPAGQSFRICSDMLAVSVNNAACCAPAIRLAPASNMAWTFSDTIKCASSHDGRGEESSRFSGVLTPRVPISAAAPLQFLNHRQTADIPAPWRPHRAAATDRTDAPSPAP
jgi:hypothetical protein